MLTAAKKNRRLMKVKFSSDKGIRALRNKIRATDRLTHIFNGSYEHSRDFLRDPEKDIRKELRKFPGDVLAHPNLLDAKFEAESWQELASGAAQHNDRIDAINRYNEETAGIISRAVRMKEAVSSDVRDKRSELEELMELRRVYDTRKNK